LRVVDFGEIEAWVVDQKVDIKRGLHKKGLDLWGLESAVGREGGWRGVYINCLFELLVMRIILPVSLVLEVAVAGFEFGDHEFQFDDFGGEIYNNG